MYVEKLIHSWKICIKFNTFHISQTIHLNFDDNLTQDDYVKK